MTSSDKPELLKRPYQIETMRPLVSFVFIIPILLAYEFACIAFDQTSVRTGVDQWLHQMLANFGIGHAIILPVVTAGTLLFLHHRKQDNWQLKPRVFVGMLVESVGLGLILFFAANAYHLLFSDMVMESTNFTILSEQSTVRWWASTVGYFGAGIYEELIFRLILFTGVIELAFKLTGKQIVALFAALLLTSLFFALSHYNVLNPAGNVFEFNTFLFRFLASIMFCIVFLFRGFGVAVGTHVAYDVLTQL